VHHAAGYLLGLALWHDHDPKEAEAQFARVWRTSEGEPEALPAALAAAEVAADRALDEATAEAYVQAFRFAGTVERESFENPWLTPADLENRAAAGFERFLAAAKFASALQLAAALPAVVPTWRRQHMTAAAHRGWAEQLLAEAGELKAAEAAKRRDEAYRNYQAAGTAYLASARERIATRDYPEEMWQAAECFWLGRGYRQTLAALEQFLANGPAERTADALVKLAEVHLALGDTPRSRSSPSAGCTIGKGRGSTRRPDSPVPRRRTAWSFPPRRRRRIAGTSSCSRQRGGSPRRWNATPKRRCGRRRNTCWPRPIAWRPRCLASGWPRRRWKARGKPSRKKCGGTCGRPSITTRLCRRG
jgi:hypothetical protein